MVRIQNELARICFSSSWWIHIPGVYGMGFSANIWANMGVQQLLGEFVGCFHKLPEVININGKFVPAINIYSGDFATPPGFPAGIYENLLRIPAWQVWRAVEINDGSWSGRFVFFYLAYRVIRSYSKSEVRFLAGEDLAQRSFLEWLWNCLRSIFWD